MKLGRLLICAAIVCSFGVQWQTCAAVGPAEKAIERAEHELTTAEHSDPSHASTESDPLSIDPDLAVWTLIVFLVLLVVLGKFAWRPIMQGLESREHAIANHIAQAQRNHEEAKNVLADYERKLAAAAGEVRELIEAARRDAEHAKQSILAEAKAGAEAEKARTLREIDTAADQAMEMLAHRSAQLAVDLASKILQSKLSKDDHARLIQEALAKFPAASSSVN